VTEPDEFRGHETSSRLLDMSTIPPRNPAIRHSPAPAGVNHGLRQHGFAFEGYAIVSADGMIADRNGYMPEGLKHESDARFFRAGLDRATLLVHGRHSHEQQGPVSERRKRLVVTGRIAGFSVHPSLANAWVWNPASMPFDQACVKIGVTEGNIAVIGGTGVFGLFLKIGFAAFHLSRADKLVLPGGRPVFPEVPAKTPQELLTEHGLKPGPLQCLPPRECDTGELAACPS
jgi:dihydrofolate reductase